MCLNTYLNQGHAHYEEICIYEVQFKGCNSHIFIKEKKQLKHLLTEKLNDFFFFFA